MDFNKTIDLIIRDLEEAGEIIEDLKNYPGVPAIQVELAKAKCRNAAEVIALLKDQKIAVKTEVGKPKTEDGRRKMEVEEQSDKIPQSGNRRPMTPTRTYQSGTDEKAARPETEEKVIPAAGIIADTFGDLPGSLNETIGSMREENDIPEYLKSQPLEKLSQAIGVNDRFLFIRELFDGNSESYNQAITRIDEAGSFADAKAVIMSCTGVKSETDAGRQLLDIVKRKFPGDE